MGISERLFRKSVVFFVEAKQCFSECLQNDRNLKCTFDGRFVEQHIKSNKIPMPDSGYLCIFSKITIFTSKYRMQNKLENRSRRFSEDTECKKALIKKKIES